MRSYIYIFLTSIWLTGILAPPILQLFDVNRPILVVNLNEEEPQEQAKKDLSEELILTRLTGQQSMIFLRSFTKNNWDHSLNYVSFTSEIPLPPPEVIQ
jgi:hypothetical protein